MATDPSSIIQGMLQSAGLGRTVSDFQQQDAQTQGMNLRNQAAQMQMSQEQAQAQRMQAFQTALTGFGTDPSDGNLARIALQFPEQVDTLKKQKQLLDAPVLNSHKTYFSGLERVAGAGNKKLATQQLQSMITAEKAQGHDTSEAEDMLSAIGAGEPDALKRVQAFAKGQLYVIDPEYAAAIDKAQDENAKHFASTSDGAIYDDRTGQVAREAVQKYVSVKDGEKLVPVGRDGSISEGGGQASGGGGAASSGAPAGRTTGGWTPRTRNGGDNPDAAVDNKISGAAQFLGVSPTDDISKLSPRKIAEAMTLSEGGKGSLADRNNNPGNIRNGDGSYKKYLTKEAGLNAAAALVARKLRNGQTNVKTLIEGLPARGGGTAAPAGGDPAGTIYGAPKTKEQFRILDASEVPAGLDPNIRYQVSPNGQITPLGGQKQGNLKPWPAAALAARVQNDSSLKNITSTLSLLDPRNNSVEAQRARKATGPGTGLLSNYVTDNITDPNGVDFRARIGQIGGIIIKDTSGAAVSISEDSRLAKWVPKVTDTTSQVRAKLANLKREIQQRNQAMEETYTEDQGFRPLHAQNVPAGPPPGAIQMLMNNPKLRSAFDAKYGKGAAARVLK